MKKPRKRMTLLFMSWIPRIGELQDGMHGIGYTVIPRMTLL